MAAGSRHGGFETALAEIGAAATDMALWPAALEAAADYVGAAGALVTQHDYRTGRHWMLTARMREDLNALYLARHTANPAAVAAMRQAPGSVFRSSAVCDFKAVLRSEYGVDCLVPQRYVELVLSVNGRLTSAGSSGGFGFQFDDLDTVDDRGFARCERLSRHLHRSVDLALELDEARAKSAVFGSLLEALPSAAFLIDRSSRVLALNAAASRLLAERTALRMEQRRLAASAARSCALAAALARAVGGSAPPAGSAFRIADPDGTLLVVVSPLSPGAPVSLVGDGGAPLVLVRAIDPCAGRSERTPLFASLFGLTPAEQRVAALVGTGSQVPAAARRLGVSAHTVRTHLTRVFEKAGVRNQVELAALIEALPGDVAPHSVRAGPAL